MKTLKNTVLFVLVAIVAVVAFDAANKAGSNRKVMTDRVVVEGQEQVRSFVCRKDAFLFSVDKEGCFDARTEEYLGDYWDLKPELAKSIPDFLK